MPAWRVCGSVRGVVCHSLQGEEATLERKRRPPRRCTAPEEREEPSNSPKLPKPGGRECKGVCRGPLQNTLCTRNGSASGLCRPIMRLRRFGRASAAYVWCIAGGSGPGTGSVIVVHLRLRLRLLLRLASSIVVRLRCCSAAAPSQLDCSAPAPRGTKLQVQPHATASNSL